jgi:thiol-disulfide isomerase/thioredoxin
LVVVAIAAVIAIVASGGDSKKVATPAAAAADSCDTTALSSVGGSTDGEQQQVNVTGCVLPDFVDGTDPGVGKQAPVLSGKSFDGTPVTITPGKDGPLMVVFVAHWCPHCQREVPLLVKWQATAEKPANLKVIAVATGSSKDAPNYPPSAWLTTQKWPGPIMADSTTYSAAQAYGLKGYPYFVLINSDGTVAARSSGEIAMTDLTALVKSSVH